MKPIIFFLALLLTSVHLTAQLSDDFSDGDFSANPQWFGETGKFVVTAEELQLNDLAPASNNTASLYLSAPTSTQDSTTWECYVRMIFAASASNYARLYLAASSEDFTGPLNGYYLRIGGSSGSTDAVQLFRQDGATSTLLLSGVPGGVGGDPVTVRVRVTRSVAGEWTLWTDYSGGNNFQAETTATDATHAIGQYFGVVCYYTTTRAQSFFFDDVRITPLYLDNQPPVLTSVQTPAPNRIIASFNEPLGVASISEEANFLVSGIGTPTSAAPVAGDPASVELILPSAMVNLQNYTLTVDMIEDQNSNVGGEQQFGFTFFNIQPPAPGDVIISEIMADPFDQVGLPEAEFVELYNRSNKIIRLNQLSFSAGSSAQELPDVLLLPGAYVVVCDEDFVPDFTPFGAVASVGSFPSLTNGGARLALTDESGTVIFEVSYSSDWYADVDKAEGGYTLEMINLDGTDIYDCPGNWRASASSTGGTPGQQNSLFGVALEQLPPVLVRAFAESSSEISLVFNEPLSFETAENTGNYAISNGLTATSATLQTPDRTQVLLTLSAVMETGIVYTITARSGHKDCLGNTTANEVSVKAGLAEPVSPGDVVINEILFNPATGGSDFIELYNRSNKIFDLFGWTIANTADATDGEKVILTDFTLFPGEYVVFSPSRSDVLAQYTVENPGALLENDLPTLEDDLGNVSLVVQNQTIDAFDYTDDLHNALLNDKNGVSLERISPDQPTQSDGNWHSAAATAGYGTPTSRNSQYADQAPTPGAEFVTLINTTFSPDSDGVEDVLTFAYAVDKPGYAMNARVFDAAGREVRNLLNNLLLASEGILKWDGSANDGSRARLGIYVLWVELIHPEGNVERVKLPCVLAGKF
ncbi:MAG: lamin tail domain-containing protein [Saprospiraceae bacterium]|nr:lamin tail domain-containing protein [Saprospiraceae bacterium]